MMGKVTKNVISRRKPPAKGGSRKGIPNKITSDVKAMILQALHDAGGAKYLLKQADTNPKAFLALVGKVLPLQLTGGDGGAVLFEITAREADL